MAKRQSKISQQLAAVSVEFHCLHRPTLEPGLQGLKQLSGQTQYSKEPTIDKLTVLNYVVTCKFTFSRPIELHLYCSRTGSFNRLFSYYFQLLTNIFCIVRAPWGV